MNVELLHFLFAWLTGFRLFLGFFGLLSGVLSWSSSLLGLMDFFVLYLLQLLKDRSIELDLAALTISLNRAFEGTLQFKPIQVELAELVLLASSLAFLVATLRLILV